MQDRHVLGTVAAVLVIVSCAVVWRDAVQAQPAAAGALGRVSGQAMLERSLATKR